MNSTTSKPSEDRRGFVKKVVAGSLGALSLLIPSGAGLAVFLDPLRRKAGGPVMVRVAALDAIPNDGVPRRFPLVAGKVDAWNKFPEAPVGAVFLRRIGDGTVEAFNVACPHAGCFVSFLRDRKTFFCPCHNSSFNLDGTIADPSSPSPRGLDALEVEVRNGGEVWVKFQNFRAGVARKIPLA